MAVTGDTQLAQTKAELISALVQRELLQNTVIAPTLRDVSMFSKGKGHDQVSFPKKSSFTIENRASAAAATIQDLDFAKDTMLLSHRATVSWLIDSMDALESSVDVELEYVKSAAAGHGVYVDDQAILKLEEVGVATTTAGAISDTVILEMRQSLLRNKANPNDLFLAISPEEESVMFGINKFISADYNSGAVIPNGVLGRIYGMNVIMSTGLSAGQYFAYESAGAAIGFQRDPQIDERKAPEYGTGSMLKVMDQKFGVTGLQLGQQGVGAALSALVVKDNN